MAQLIKLPTTQNLPWYRFTMILEGVTYGFEMAYNTRSDRWQLSVLDAIGTVVVSHLPVLIDRDLLQTCRHLAVPQGLLVCIDTSGKQQPPTLGSFLVAHGLYYLESV